MSDFQTAYDRIREATGLRTQTEVAALLGVRQSSISDAKRRDSIPAQWLLILFDKHALNPTWVRTGEGAPYLAQSPGQPPNLFTPEQCIRRLEPVLRAALLTTVPALAAELRQALGLPVPEESGGPEEASHDAR
jgi:bacteriophage CI repressor helix-turn-helix domain